MRPAQHHILWIVVAMLSPLVSWSTIHRVNNTPQAPVGSFSSLQDAIYASSTTVIDTIIVEHSDIVYDPGGVVVSRKVRIFGTGYFLEDNECTQADERESTFDLITFTDSTGVGGPSAAGSYIGGIKTNTILVECDQVRVSRCQVNQYLGIGTDGPISNVMVYQCFLKGDVDSLISVVNCSNFIVRNSVIYNSRSPEDPAVHNMRVYDGNGIIMNNLFYGEQDNVFKNATIQNNMFSQSEFDVATSSNVTAQNNISESDFLSVFDNGGANNNIFDLAYSVDSLNCHTLLSGVSRDGEFQLNATWTGADFPPNPAFGNAADGGNIGIMGGSDPYVLSGMPPLPSIAQYNGSASGTQSGGTSATVKGKSRR